MQTVGGYQLQSNSPGTPGTPSSAPQGRMLPVILMWITGSILILASGCIASAFSMMSIMSMDELHKTFPPEQVQIIETLYPNLIHLAVFFMAIGFVPGIAVVVLAFGVMSAKKLALKLSFVMLSGLTLMYGLILSLNIISGIMTANPIAVLVNLIFVGGFVLMLGATARSLYRLRNHSPNASDDLDAQSDPWNDEPGDA